MNKRCALRLGHYGKHMWIESGDRQQILGECLTNLMPPQQELDKTIMVPPTRIAPGDAPTSEKQPSCNYGKLY